MPNAVSVLITNLHAPKRVIDRLCECFAKVNLNVPRSAKAVGDANALSFTNALSK